MRSRYIWTSLSVLLALAGLGIGTAQAATATHEPRDFQQSRPIRMVAPFAAGSSSDAFGRYLAPKLSQRLEQNVVVENRPGAGGMIGASIVAKGTPDGKHVAALGGDIHPSSPEEMRQRVEGEIAKWRRIVAERKIEIR